MEKLIKQHKISFDNAWAGLRWAFTTQPNFKIHISLSIIVLIISWMIGLDGAEFAVIVFTILLGLSAEMINTALESMTDLITSQWRQEAKIAKDVSAGMMLLVSFGAVIIALVVLGPKLLMVAGV
jgi:diacylglycerol kinase